MQTDDRKRAVQEQVEQAIRKVIKTDVALGLICLAPLISMFWRIAQDDRFTFATLGPIALLYCWTMGACFLLLIRKIRDKSLRRSILLFSTGSFASCFALSFALLPPMLAVGAVPICSYLMTKLRARYYRELDVRKELAGKASNQGQLEV